MEHFNSDGVDIAYVDIGTGEPILLIHGFASNHRVNWQSTSWFDTLTAAGRRVIAMDVRGHGESAKIYEAEKYRPTLLAKDAANLLDHLHIERADVMGYSMGGRIAAALAIEHPGKVKALIIGGIGMGLVEGLGGEQAIAAAMTAPTAADTTNEVARGYRTFADRTKGDRLALASCILGYREPVGVAQIAKIKAPTLIAVGSRDEVAGSAHDLARLIPGAEVLDIPNRDHMLATGDKVYKAGVLDFLRRHP